jgi:CDK inhibitor PHO81
MRGIPDMAQNHVEWGAVEEGFRLLERDLGKLQVRSAPNLLQLLV